MAQLLRKQQKYEEGIVLLEKILENRKKSPVDIKYQWNGYDFILRVLTELYYPKNKSSNVSETAWWVYHAD